VRHEGLRERLLPGVEQAAGLRFSLTDLLLRAQAPASRDCPYANAIWLDGQVVRLPGCDIDLEDLAQYILRNPSPLRR
jgi:hypothetical protein